MTIGDRMRRIERILRIAPGTAKLLAPAREKNFRYTLRKLRGMEASQLVVTD
jgi:hypothetical protein